MRKSLRYLAVFLSANIISVFAFAQTTIINGNIKNSLTGDVVSAASVTVKGSGAGTFTDDKGNFHLSVNQKLPLTLVVSSVGFETQEVAVSNSSDLIQVSFKASNTLGQEVVVAATRTPSRILESPVSIERVSAAAIRNAPSPSYYDLLGTLKGVDLTTSSFAFKTPSTRGFNGSGNLRFNQFVDGMDNQAPALNFAVGSIIGLTELDVESMELLPGASSALYGSGGENGTLLISSKSPFKYQGLSFQIKQGINHVDNYERRGAPYFDWSVRYAQKVSDKFAYKIGAQLVQAQDWQGNDTRDLLRNNVISSLKQGGTRVNDPNYDGVNVFGDEASASMQAFAQAVQAQTHAGLLAASGGAYNLNNILLLLPATPTPAQIGAFIAAQPAPFQASVQNVIPFNLGLRNNIYGSQAVSRTGYNERDLVNYNAYNVRFSAGLNYKVTDDIEASFLGYFGKGTSVYTGADRYSLKNLNMGQYKLELKSKNWFLRGYTTQENSGDSYTATTAALYINNAWKDNRTWFQQYTGTYSAARLGLTAAPIGFPDSLYHSIARGAADAGRVLPGTTQFNQLFQNAISTNVSAGGAKFADKSNLYQFEGQLNVTDQVQFAETLIGASYRRYSLNSQGTIFVDTTGRIPINEYGAYVQLSKKLLNDVLKLTGSVRYDKNENFDGRFTPRISALVKVKQDNNIRLSYQTAYRFPSTQDQYINLLTGGVNRLIGGLPEFNTFFNFDNNPAYTSQSIVAYRSGAVPNPAVLQKAQFTTIRPESVQSYEAGFKGLLTKKFLLDVYYYTSKYTDFIARAAVGRGISGDPAKAPIDLASPFTTNNISFVVNSPTPVKANGYGAGFEWNVIKNYIFNVNAFGDELKNVPAGLVTFFNTPKFRYNIGLSNSDVHNGFGFNVNYRRQTKINWEGTFGSGEVPAYETVDAMVSYKLKSIKSLIKLGSSNLFNKYYRSAFGNPQVGGLYYISFGYNIF